MNGRRYRDFDEWTFRRVLRANKYYFERVSDVLGIDSKTIKSLAKKWGVLMPLLTKRIKRSELREMFQVKHPADVLILENSAAEFRVVGFKNQSIADTIKKEWGIDPDLGAVIMEYDGTTDDLTFYQFTNTAAQRPRQPAYYSV